MPLPFGGIDRILGTGGWAVKSPGAGNVGTEVGTGVVPSQPPAPAKDAEPDPQTMAKLQTAWKGMGMHMQRMFDGDFNTFVQKAMEPGGQVAAMFGINLPQDTASMLGKTGPSVLGGMTS
jgi:hypothetical protein